MNEYFAYYTVYIYTPADHSTPLSIKNCTVYLPHEFFTVEDIDNVTKELTAEMDAEQLLITFFARIESNGKPAGREVVVDGSAER